MEVSTSFPACKNSTVRDPHGSLWVQPWKLSLNSPADHSSYVAPEQRHSCSWVIARTFELDFEFNWPQNSSHVFSYLFWYRFKMQCNLQGQREMTAVSDCLESASLFLSIRNTITFRCSERKTECLSRTDKWLDCKDSQSVTCIEKGLEKPPDDRNQRKEWAVWGIY